MTISALPTPPSTSSPSTFATLADAFLAALPTFRTEANALAAAMNAIAAGTALSIPYTFDTATGDSDPDAGKLRLNQATQNTATVIRADLLSSAGSDFTNVLATFDDSTSTIKGYIALVKASDATKFLIFSVASMASPSGYRNITVTNVASSAASPFADGDAIILKFTRTGDKGDTGATGAAGANPLWTPLDLVTGSGVASLDLTQYITSTYKKYRVDLIDIVSSAGSPNVTLQIYESGSFKTSASYRYSGSRASSGSLVQVSADPESYILLGGTGSGADDSFSGSFEIANPAGTTRYKPVKAFGSRILSNAISDYQFSGHYFSNTNAITQLRIALSSGNISGTVRLSGLSS